jgi:hypothetical protein
MGDDEAAARKAAIAARKLVMKDVDVAKERPGLLKFAIASRRDHNEARAEEDVNDAIANAYDPDYQAWDETKESISDYFRRQVHSVIKGKTKRAEVRGAHATAESDAPIEWQRSKAPTPEELANLRGMIEQCKTRLEVALGPQGRVFLETLSESTDDQAKALGLSSSQAVYDLKRKVFLLCQKIAPELGLDASGNFLRRPASREQMQLEAEIRAMLPFRARWKRYASTAGAFLLLFAAIAFVVALFYFNPLGKRAKGR